ncbi:MAG: hypothetical protein IPM29_06330 [Planctomycetes bacterium]|nr:hypothetical protein [Planctomycetota bacterium]
MNALWSALLENTAVAALLALVLGASVALFRPRAALRHLGWLVVVVALVLPPVVGWRELAPAQSERLDALVSAVVGTGVRTDDPTDAASDLGAAELSEPPSVADHPGTRDRAPATLVPVALPAAAPSSSPAGAPRSETRATAWLTLAWLLGATAFASLALRRTLRLRGWLAHASDAVPPFVVAESRALAAALGIRPPLVLAVRGLAAPATGLVRFRSAVLWPRDWTARSERTVAILAHELAHVRRRDPWIAIVTLAVGVLHWWNPLFWLARSRLREAAEQACDSCALALRTLAPRELAEALLELRSAGVDQLAWTAAATASGSNASFRRRLRAVMTVRPTAGGSPAIARAGAAALLLVALPGFAPTHRDTRPDEPSTPLAMQAQQDPAGPAPIGEITHVSDNGALCIVELRPDVFLAVEDRVRLVDGSELTVDQRIGDALTVSSGDRGPVTLRRGMKVVDAAWGRSRLGPARRGEVGEPVQDAPLTATRWLIELVTERAVLLAERDVIAIARGGRFVARGAIAWQRNGQRLGVWVAPRDVPAIGGPGAAQLELVAIDRPRLETRRPRPDVPLGAPLPLPDVGRPGHTWIADYSDNRIVEFDGDDREVDRLEDAYGAWDVDPLPGGHLLVTEFALSRVIELDAERHEIWRFDELRNAYSAQRLPEGNTLIADTFGNRVIEVTPAGEIAWEHAGIRPFDAERLANGNTLVADTKANCVLELDPSGDVVWELRGLPGIHDADRLPNGNTLVTLRAQHCVLEITPDGDVVGRLEQLNSPSDADRLPDGNTLVAENGQVREFDPTGHTVATLPCTWAVEATRR